MKKLHLLCLIFLFGNRAFSILQVINYSYDDYLIEFIILLTIILLERVANIIYSQYYIYIAYRNIPLNIVQFLSSLVFLDYTNMGLLRKEDLRFSNSIFIRNMNITSHFLSVVPLVFNFICITYTNGEEYFLVYPFTVFFLIFTMSLVSTVYIYENQQNVPYYRCIVTFLMQYLRTYALWNITSQLFYRIPPFILIYCVIIFLCTLLFYGISKEGNSSSQANQQFMNNNNNYNNNNMNNFKFKDKARFLKVLIAQALMMVLIENIWAFDKKMQKKPCIRKIAQSMGVYIFFCVAFIVKMCSFTYENYLDYPIYLYGIVCLIEIYCSIQNMLFYQKYGPYQDAIQMKHLGSLQELDLEKSLISKYQNRTLLTKFNFNILLERPSVHEEFNINHEEFSKHICQILFKISQNQCRISINISNAEELILSRKDTEIIFGIKRSANQFIVKFLLSLYNHIQLIDQYQKSKVLNIYFTNKDQLQVTLRQLEKALVQASQACIQPKMVLNFKEIQTFNQMNCIFQQQFLMIYLFNTHISNSMLINPNAILYDLHEDFLS